MNTATLTILRSGLLATAMAAVLIAQPATADDKAMMSSAAPAGEQCPHMGGKHGDPAAHLQHKLDDLSDKLHLKDNQKAAWKDYREYLTQMGAEHQKMRESMHGAGGMMAMKNLPAPERMQKMADHMRLAADALDKLAKRSATFYKTLSPEQQTIFDLYQSHLRPHGGMMKMKHGM